MSQRLRAMTEAEFDELVGPDRRRVCRGGRDGYAADARAGPREVERELPGLAAPRGVDAEPQRVRDRGLGRRGGRLPVDRRGAHRRPAAWTCTTSRSPRRSVGAATAARRCCCRQRGAIARARPHRPERVPRQPCRPRALPLARLRGCHASHGDSSTERKGARPLLFTSPDGEVDHHHHQHHPEREQRHCGRSRAGIDHLLDPAPAAGYIGSSPMAIRWATAWASSAPTSSATSSGSSSSSAPISVALRPSSRSAMNRRTPSSSSENSSDSRTA